MYLAELLSETGRGGIEDGNGDGDVDEDEDDCANEMEEEDDDDELQASSAVSFCASGESRASNEDSSNTENDAKDEEVEGFAASASFLAVEFDSNPNSAIASLSLTSLCCSVFSPWLKELASSVVEGIEEEGEDTDEDGDDEEEVDEDDNDDTAEREDDANLAEVLFSFFSSFCILVYPLHLSKRPLM